MNIFLAIMTVVLFLLIFVEKDDCKRKHLTWCFIAVLGAIALITVVNIITLLL
jgi:hypothetical protein